MKAMVLILMFFPFSAALAITPEIIDTDKEIAAILSKIPVKDKDFSYHDIGERLVNVGMKATMIMVYRLTKKADLELPEDRIGDVIYEIYTTNPPDALKVYACDMMGSPEFRKRGNKYIPESRTAIWLMTSRCETPK